MDADTRAQHATDQAKIAALVEAQGNSPFPSATELADFREHQAESEYSHSDNAHQD